MTTKVDYTDDEWQLLIDVPMMVGAAVMMIGKSGLGSMKESFAMAQEVIAAVKDYPDNELIQAIMHDRIHEKKRSTIESLKDNPYRGMQREEFLQAAKEKAAAVADLLARKSTPEEAREYKEWAFYIGDKVALAASEGGFLGIGGEQFSDEEREALNELMAAIGLTKSESGPP